MPATDMTTARKARLLAIVGAESTGKSTLAEALARRLAEATGWRCGWVPEVLRGWCEREGRTPRADEQAGIAAEQASRIDSAASTHELVVCDTTPLMTAVYHRQVFGLNDLDEGALAWQRRCDLTLLTALDLPWQADGLQRDGAHVREPVDARIREMLITAGLPFVVVAGQGEARLESAVNAVSPLLLAGRPPHGGLFSRLAARDAAQPEWRWVCETCDVPDCEHASLRLRRRQARPG
jgi:nicotinamide riboside kinase